MRSGLRPELRPDDQAVLTPKTSRHMTDNTPAVQIVLAGTVAARFRDLRLRSKTGHSNNNRRTAQDRVQSLSQTRPPPQRSAVPSTSPGPQQHVPLRVQDPALTRGCLPCAHYLDPARALSN